MSAHPGSSVDAAAFGTYDFGLDPEAEERARGLHEESTIVDLLYWGPVGPVGFPTDVETVLAEEWLPNHDPQRVCWAALRLPAERCVDGDYDEYRARWEQSGVTAGTRSVEVATPELTLATFGDLQMQFDRLPWLVKALRAEDIRAAKRSGQRAAILNTQLISGPGPDLLASLGSLHDLGLRMLMLTYNVMTVIGSGCAERTDAGVSRYGADVIAEMNRLGMIVDTSHCGLQTTLDACALSERPVIASHTTARSVFGHTRGKPDEVLKALADSGGVVGINAVPFFLAAEGEATLDRMLDHLDHMVNVVGWEHVALGTDWPNSLPASIYTAALGGAVATTFRPEDAFAPESRTKGFEDYRDYPNITRGLVARGYGDDQIRGILGENAVRVFAEVCG